MSAKRRPVHKPPGQGVNVQVVLRVRPLNDKEKRTERNGAAINVRSQKEVTVQQQGGKSKNANYSKNYTFDSVYGPESSQLYLYQSTVAPIIEEVLKGFNCTIFAYGQTGTGKTFTMEGDTYGKNMGVIPRSVKHIFQHLETTSSEYTVRVSHLELYNEELIDLLSTEDKQLRIFEEPQGGVSVHNLEFHNVKSSEDIISIIEKSTERRVTAETDLNKGSSRSHCIFTITIHMKEAGPDGEEFIKVGKLNLVDLAGSENIGRSGAVDERKREAGNINQSLLTLGRVITSLTQHCGHIPYRESKLTRLLQESLGGKTKTCIIATVSPANWCIDETLSTLDYAHRAKDIRNKPEVNQKLAQKAVMKDLSDEISSLKRDLAASREKDGFYLSASTYEGMTKEIEENKKRIETIEATLETKVQELQVLQDLLQKNEVLLTNKTKQYNETKHELNQVTEELSDTKEVLVDTKITVAEQTVFLEEFEQTEHNLQKEANSIIKSLEETSNDVLGLHQKIGRKNSVEVANVKKVGEFKSFLSQNVDKICEKKTDFQNEKDVNFQMVLKKVDDYQKQKTSEMNQISTQINTALDLITQSSETILDLNQHYQQNNNLNKFNEIQEDQTNQLLNSCTQFFDKSIESMNLLSEVCKNHQNQISNFEENLNTQIKDCFENINSFTKNQNSNIQNIKETVNNSTTEQISNLQKDESLIETIVQQQKEKSNNLQENLIFQMSVLMNQYKKDEEESLHDLTNQFKNSVSENIKSSEGLKTEVFERLGQTESQIVEFSEDNERRNIALDTLISANTENNQTEFTKKQDISTTVLLLIPNAQENIINITDSSDNEVKENVESQVEELNGLILEQKEKVDTLLNNASENTQQLEKNVVESIENTEAVVGNLETDLESNRQKDQTFLEEESKAIVSLKEELLSLFNTLKQDQPTGETPVKKQYKMWNPTELPKTNPKAVVLKQRTNKLNKIFSEMQIENKENVNNNNRLASV